MKLFFLCLVLCFASACSTPTDGFEPKESDKLTDRERFALYDYARSFLFSSKKIKLRKADRDLISKNDPRTRVHYKDSKSGTLRLYWDLPGNRQVIVIAEGYLVILRSNKASWSVHLIAGQRGSGAYNPKRYGIE